MPVSPHRGGMHRILRSAAVALATLSLITCAEDPIGPATGQGHLRLVPVFGPYARVAPLILDQVRIVVERLNTQAETSDTLVDEVRAFDVNQNQLRIDDITIPMQVASEDLLVSLQLLANGTLLWDGSQLVRVVRGQLTAPTSIPLNNYRGPGANVATLSLAPRDTVLSPGATLDYRLDAFDIQGADVPQYYVSWSLTGGPATGARINAAGRLTAPSVQDTFYVKVVAPNGVMDSTRVIIAPFSPPTVTPVPLAAGDHQTCEIRGTVTYCWGLNDLGQLGDGTTTERLVPTPVAGGQTFVAVSTGNTHTCALTATGQAFCWGDNSTGALGDGGTTNRPTPVAVSGGFSFAQIVAADQFTCGVTLTGEARCWGANFYGQLGDGTTTDRLTPTIVAGGHRFTRISAAGFFDSQDHACAIDGAGVAWCWGSNDSGELGTGNQTASPTPVAVTGGVTFSEISVGGASSCAIGTSGAGFCWGDNLGVAITSPQPLAGGFSYTALDMGADHVCGRTATGWVCGGDNNSGQLGDGTTTNRPTPVVPSGGHSFSAIAAGDEFTCGVTASGTYCWGFDGYGQLGTGDATLTNHLTPTLVVGAPASVASIAGDGQTAPAGSTLPIPPAVLVHDAQGNPIPGVEVIFAVTAGGGNVGDGSLTESALTNASGIAAVSSWTLGAAPGGNSLSATVSAAGVTGNPVSLTATGVTGNLTLTWTGAVSTDWSVAGNWSPAQVPGILDSVVIGVTASGRQPSLSTTAPAGAVSIIAGGNLTINGQGITIARGFSTSGTGVLTMTNGADVVVVGGDAVFDGGSELNRLAAGGMSIGGNLTQRATTSGESFRASGTHVTALVSATPTLSFATPGTGAGTSGFQDLAWVGAGTLTLATPVVAQGSMVMSAGAASTISSATGARLTVGELASVAALVFNNVPLTLNEAAGDPLTLNNITFQNMPTTVSQLVVSHPGGTFDFTNLVFSTTPAAPNGFYLDVTDPTGPADGTLVINMVNPTPATPGAFVRQTGAVVNWPSAAAVTWTGAADIFWDNPANWSPRVPVASDDVVIPAVARHPSLQSSVAVHNLTIAAGAGLDLGSGFGITISGSLAADAAISGSVTGSLVTLSGSGQSLRGLIEANTSITGSYALNGALGYGQNSNGTLTLGITGSLDLAGHTANVRGSLTTTGTGVLRMGLTLDSMLVTKGSSGGGSASFGGGSTAGTLTAGVMVLAGSLTQTGTATSFAPSGGHKTVFSASSGDLTFADPVNSGFQDLDITGSGLILRSDMRIKGVLIAAGTSGVPSLNGIGFFTVTTAGVNVSALQMSSTALVIQGGPITQFDNVRFSISPTTVPQLTVNHPGAATPISFNNLTFLTVPTAPNGFYLRANDTDGASPNVLTINMVNPSPATGAPYVDLVGGAVVGWPPTAPVKNWIGTSGASWFTTSNWNPAGVPTATDNLVIPASTVTLDPCPAAAATADLTVQAGGQIIGACQLLVAGNLTSTGTINVDVALTGAGKTLQGNFGTITMAVTGTVSLAGNTTVQGNIGTTAGGLTLGGHSLRAAGFATAGTGTLTMTSVSDSLIVSGATIFGGGSTAGKLTAGRLLIGGSLSQTGTGSMFAPSGTHRTVFTELSSLTLADTVNSGFQDFDMNGQTVTAQSAVPIKGTLFASGLSFLELPNGNRVTTAGVNVSALVVETGPMLIQGGPITRFDSVTFAAQNAAGTQLTIRHPGAATPFTFTQLQFVTAPTTGFYIDATDTDGATGGLLTINMVTPSPATPAGRIQTSGGAVINWGPVAIQWNGSSSTDWSTGANWVGGIVPGTTDSVVIPAATNQPVLTAAASVGAVVVSGGTLTLNSQTLTVSRTFATTGTGTLTSNTAASLLVVAGNAVFGGGDETGRLTDGNLRVAGNFTQGTTANSFVASGLHTTFFNGTGAQTVTIANGGAASSRFQNVRVANGTGTVTLSGTTPEMVVNGTLTVASGPGLTGATAVTAANVSTSTGSTLSVFLLTVPANAITVAGTYGVNTTILTGGGTVPAITYNNLRLTGATAYTLGSNVTTAGFLDLQSELIVAGHTFAVGGDLLTTGTGVLTMTNAADLVTVVGSTSFSGGDETGKLTAGILRTSNQFLQDATTSPASFVASLGHTVEIVSQNPSGGVVNFGNPTVSHFQNLRVLFISQFVSDIEVKGNMEVNFNAPANFLAKRVTVGGNFTKSGIGFFGPTRLTLQGGSTVSGDVVGPDTLEFAGGLPQTYPNPSSTSPKYVLVANDVTAGTGVANITNDLEIRGNGIFRMGTAGNTFNVGGSLRTVGTGRVQMIDPSGTIKVTGDATFSGGDETALLTAGTLQVQGNFTQSAITSVTSFSPSGTHKTVLGSAAARAISIGSPGAGAGGSHFQVLDVSTATGGLSLDVNMEADSLISNSAAAKLTSPGVTLTVRRAQVSGLILDNTSFVLDEQVTSMTENFSNVTFTGFPTTNTTMLTVVGPGSSLTARPAVTTTNLNFQSLPIGANNFYVDLTSSNGAAFGMTMTGSNQGLSAGGNGPALTKVTPGTGVATVSWP